MFHKLNYVLSSQIQFKKIFSVLSPNTIPLDGEGEILLSFATNENYNVYLNAIKKRLKYVLLYSIKIFFIFTASIK